ncbi:hypothetical protein PVAP13_8NG123800, partial [Panicum virgatum]
MEDSGVPAWDPSQPLEPLPSGDDGSSSERTSYEEEVSDVEPCPRRQRRTEEEDPNFEPVQENPSLGRRSRRAPQREVEDTAVSAPPPSVSAPSREKKPRGKNGRNKMPEGQFIVETMNAKGEITSPKETIKKFRTACGYLVREHVPITFKEWNALTVMGKCWRNWKSDLNTFYVQKNKTPSQTFGKITPSQWDEFVAQKTSPDALALHQSYSDLAKKNIYPHHLGTGGYIQKINQWRREEEERREKGLADPLERARNWVYARKAKEVEGGRLECQEPQTSEVVAKIKEVAQKQKSGEFEENREYDQLTAGLGNPERKGRVRGISSKMSWKVGFDPEKYGARYKRHDKYRETIKELARVEAERALKEKFVKYLQEAGVIVQGAAGDDVEPAADSLPPNLPRTSLQSTARTKKYPIVDDIDEPCPCQLHTPFGRSAHRTVHVADATLYPPDKTYRGRPTPDHYAKVYVSRVEQGHEMEQLDHPTPDITHLGDAKDQFVLWHKADI